MIEEEAEQGNPTMQAGQWLALTDYASKYRVSVSTLRRRIKGGQLEHRFEEGKYLLLDEAPSFIDHMPVHQHASNDLAQQRPTAVESIPLRLKNELKMGDMDFVESAPSAPAPTKSNVEQKMTSSSADEPILSSATRLVNELKRAYMSILHEKEVQLIQLKEEVSDLKTLVRVLEDDNDRMRGERTQRS
jgi:hypothetical protein